MLHWLFFVAVCSAAKDHSTSTNTTSTSALPELSLPTLSSSTSSWATVTQQVDSATSNPYIQRSNLPENFLLVIIGGVLGLIAFATISAFIFASIISRRKARNESEKYYYNTPFSSYTPFQDNSSSSFSSSSILETKSSLSNMSQLTLGQPLGNSYKNAALGNNNNNNNRGSMFFSPTTDIFVNNNSSSNFGNASVVDLGFTYNSSSVSLLDPESQISSPDLQNGGNREQSQSNLKPKRPPSQYLEDFLDEKSFL